MNLLFVIFNSEYVGGGAYIIFKYAEYLAKRGRNIYVLCANWPALYKKRKNLKNITITVMGGKDFPLSLLYYNTCHMKKIHDFLNKHEIDYIITHPDNQTYLLSRLSKKFNVPLVTFAYESPLWVKERLKNNMTLKTKIKFFINNIIRWKPLKKAMLNSDKIVPISDLARRDFERWLNKPIDGVVHPGVDSDFIDSIPNKKEKYQIIYVGRLFKNKNVDEIIKALAKIINHPKFVIIGHGPERPKLEKLAIELNVNCEFKGVVSDYDKWVEIKKSLFMVVATSFEGSADVPSEALYCEKPCLATDIPIMRADYGDTIEYFREHDVDDLAEKIKYLIDNPRYRKMKGRVGKRFVDENYTLKVATEKLEKILLE